MKPDERSHQSPIDLSRDISLYSFFNPKFLTWNYPKPEYLGEYKEDKHHWIFELKDSDPPTVSLGSHETEGIGGINARLVQAHVHAKPDQGSEHTFNKKHSSVEVHLVHKIDHASSGQTDSTLVVLGVLFQWKDPKQAKAIPANQLPVDDDRGEIDGRADEFFKRWVEGMVDSIAKKRQVPVPLDLGAILNLVKNTWYRYEGSLTSGDTPEVVTWYVFNQVLPISVEAVEDLKKHACQESRLTQHRKRRIVLRNFDPPSHLV